jgi:hypothetical protein
MRLAALTLAVVLALATPAHAAGVGFSLPKFRALTVGAGAGAANSLGGSVQVVGTSFSIRPIKFNVGLDYAFTRDFAAGANYSFFDLTFGAGVPFGFTSQFYVEPALDTHTLLFVASPEGLGTPAFGAGPRLTGGFKPTANIAVELSAGYALMLNMMAAGRSTPGGLLTVEIGGTYSF